MQVADVNPDPERRVWCWGVAPYGQTAFADPLDNVDWNHDIARVAMGTYHACAVSVDGSVNCWVAEEENLLMFPPENQPVVQVAAGALFTCALVPGAEVMCWFDPDPDGAHAAPWFSQPGNFENPLWLVAGPGHACVLVENGTIGCWGDNAYGQAPWVRN